MRPLLLALLLLPISAHAQASTADELQARLIDRPLILRGLWADDKLRFDSMGAVRGNVKQTSFTLSGIEITQVDVQRGSIALKGRRVGLEWTKEIAGPTRVPVQLLGPAGSTHDESVSIEIAAPGSHDYSAPLDAIFTERLSELVPDLPEIWQNYATKNFLPQEEPVNPGPAARANSEPGTTPVRRIGGGVTPPRVTFQTQPEFSNPARGVKLSGSVLVHLIVGEDGLPQHLRIVRPLGMGLDEQAALSVSRYKFKPAMQNGVPVKVEMNVEVNFQIF